MSGQIAGLGMAVHGDYFILIAMRKNQFSIRKPDISWAALD
jgi:hypothetical protein